MCVSEFIALRQSPDWVWQPLPLTRPCGGDSGPSYSMFATCTKLTQPFKKSLNIQYFYLIFFSLIQNTQHVQHVMRDLCVSVTETRGLLLRMRGSELCVPDIDSGQHSPNPTRSFSRAAGSTRPLTTREEETQACLRHRRHWP